MTAALLFSDISGFTALTERLQARGHEGAEEIASVVSGAFAPAIEAITRFGGSICSFGGDALFSLFPPPSPVGRARAAAGAIRDRLEEASDVRTSVGPVTLQITQAIHHGEVNGLHLGSQTSRQYLLGGRSVTALARLESRARPGSILLSREARAALARERPPRGARSTLPRVPARRLRPYLPAPVLPLLGRYEGAYRRAAVLFLETRGFELALLQPFYVALLDALCVYEGVLLKTDLSPFGAKWLCVFGIPHAHEDDPERAARAALALLSERPRALALRGGIDAGTLVNIEVGTAQRASFDIMGDVVNTAARVLSRARWNEVLATEPVRQSLASVSTRSRGVHAVKGKEKPLALHALSAVAAAPARARAEATLRGRERELSDLTDLLREARAGHGAMVALLGDAGIGKSRLAREIGKRAAAMGMTVHEGRAAPFAGGPYHAMAELLRGALDIPEALPLESSRRRIRQGAEALGLHETDRHHLADVLGVRYEGSPLRHLDGPAIRLNDAIAVRSTVLALCRSTPRLFVLEDMHQADELTLWTLEFLSGEVRASGCLVILLGRPGAPPIRGARELRLSEIPAPAVSAMVRDLLESASPDVERLVNERAEGNPFYVEELVRHLRETGLHDLPGTVASILQGRLDRLPPEPRKVAQVGAVCGRTFRLAILARLREVRAFAGRGAEELESRDLVLSTQARPESEYQWKSSLTRDVAYDAILVAHRRRLHRAVAEAIEKVDRLPPDPTILGHHWEQAGHPRKARSYHLRAARHASSRYAHAEAERLYRAYLGLVETPDDESVTARSELADGVLRVAGKTREALDEARTTLSEADALGHASVRAMVLERLGTLLRQIGDLAEAGSCHERALQIARDAGDRAAIGESLASMAMVARDQGRLDDARQLLQQAVEMARESRDRAAQASTLAHLAGVLQEVGQVEESQRAYEEALAISRDTGDRRGEGIALGNLATLMQYMGRTDRSESLLEEALAIHREVGDRRATGITLGNLAMHAQRQERPARAQEVYEQALAIHREVRNRRSEGIVLGNLAMLHKEQGRPEEARALCEAAVAIARELGDRRFLGISHANLSTLLFDSGKREEAIALMEAAIGMLRDAGDRRFEGAALQNLARYQVESGRREEAMPLIEAALAAHRQVGDRRNEGTSLRLLGTLQRERGKAKEAAASLDLAASILEEIGELEERELCLRERALLP